MMKRHHKLILLMGTQLLAGYTVVNNVIPWSYYGTPISGQFFNSSGKPTITEFTTTIPNTLPSLPSDLVSKVNYTLPEGKDIRLNPQGLMPDSDDKTNIHFSQTAEVWVTFLTEGAGYLNSVGYFSYDTANPPQTRAQVQEKMILPNASMPSPLTAATTTGNTVYLGTFQPGQSLGFMIVANGWSSTGRTVNGVRVPGVKDYADPKAIFYTLRQLNPEASDARNLNTHTLILKDLSNSGPSYQRLVIGFEDINREVGGDNDFNDVVLAIHVTPKVSISNIDTISTLVSNTDPDTDGDGVKDSLDEFPNDASKAFSHWYPSQNGWGTLAYEDSWPAKGDFDLNDLVMRYRTREIMNASRQVVGLEMDYRLDAHGGVLSTGFGVHLPGVAANKISSASLQINQATAQAVSPESGQSDAVLLLYNDILPYAMQTKSGCGFFNTEIGCPRLPGTTFHMSVNFTTPLASSLFTSPYNPFIFRTDNRGQETHLPGKAPTAKANTAFFGTVSDRSVVGTTYTYMDANRLPWALDIPSEWDYPKEKTDIVLSHPGISAWASSGGSSNTDWYFNNLVRSLLYLGQ
ncbi:LruC domain-containing protein [Chitinibacter bivalviorum]|uniref:LruC domain-containing protein n=1 Tax=Chitinibacter bivalviorum TaxID=2739434 RepID=A0A7H9BGW4_9NEIS|nr:LruC domain-containing protein [Chitinibacter bivalviorum]QLG87789.1 LruC domain-containing protein [Chitinibacter bivalviorum]